MVGYPTTDLNLGNQHRSWRAVLLGIASLALAVLVGLLPATLTRRRRRRRLPRDSAPTTDSMAEPEAVNVTA